MSCRHPRDADHEGFLHLWRYNDWKDDASADGSEVLGEVITRRHRGCYEGARHAFRGALALEEVAGKRELADSRATKDASPMLWSRRQAYLLAPQKLSVPGTTISEVISESGPGRGDWQGRAGP